MRRVPRCRLLAVALLALTLANGPALAHGHGGGHGGFHGGGGWHGGGFHGGGWHGGWHGGGWHHPGFHHEFFHHREVIFGGGPAFAYPYYNPSYYDYPGAWTYVAPSPLYAAPLAGQCRAFGGDALIAGTNQPFYGSACMQPDGQWHVVR